MIICDHNIAMGNASNTHFFTCILCKQPTYFRIPFRCSKSTACNDFIPFILDLDYPILLANQMEVLL